MSVDPPVDFMHGQKQWLPTRPANFEDQAMVVPCLAILSPLLFYYPYTTQSYSLPMPSSTAWTLGPPGVELECHPSRMRSTPMPLTLSVVVDGKATPKSVCEAMQSTIPISVSSEFSDYGHVSYSDVPMKKFYCWVYRNDGQELQRYRDRDIIEQEYELAARTLIALGRHLFSLIGREERERLQQNGLRTFLDVAYVVQEYAQDTADANTLGDGALPMTPRIQAADRAWRLPVIHPHHNLINHLMVKKEEVGPLGMTRNKLAHPRPSRADFRSFADSLPLTLDLREALVQQQHWVSNSLVPLFT